MQENWVWLFVFVGVYCEMHPICSTYLPIILLELRFYSSFHHTASNAELPNESQATHELWLFWALTLHLFLLFCLSV